jgi:hypothetical protein
MAYSKQDVQSLQQSTRTGDKVITSTIDSVNTVQILELGDVYSKISFQAIGTLLGTIEFSLNGVNFANSTAIGASNAVVSFSTHNVASVRVTWASGTGKLVLANK